MSEAAFAAAASGAASEVLKEVLKDTVPLVVNATRGAFDKVAFDLDSIGRKRVIDELQEQTRAKYEKYGLKVNIAVWNKHLPEDHNFNNILLSKTVPMGNGGGFRLVVFWGSGWIRNNGARGFDNWHCSGWQTQNGNVITFRSPY